MLHEKLVELLWITSCAFVNERKLNRFKKDIEQPGSQALGSTMCAWTRLNSVRHSLRAPSCLTTKSSPRPLGISFTRIWLAPDRLFVINCIWSSQASHRLNMPASDLTLEL